MLREISYVKQERKKDRKRWFTDDDWDVFVWNRPDGSFSGFQLCYDKTGYQRALTWMDGEAPAHTAVRETNGHAGTHDHSSPLLVADGSADIPSLVEQFRDVSAKIDADVRNHITGKLRELMDSELSP